MIISNLRFRKLVNTDITTRDVSALTLLKSAQEDISSAVIIPHF